MIYPNYAGIHMLKPDWLAVFAQLGGYYILLLFFYYHLTVKLTSLFWIMPHLSILLPQEIRCDEFGDRAMSEQDTGADVT